MGAMSSSQCLCTDWLMRLNAEFKMQIKVNANVPAHSSTHANVSVCVFIFHLHIALLSLVADIPAVLSIILMAWCLCVRAARRSSIDSEARCSLFIRRVCVSTMLFFSGETFIRSRCELVRCAEHRVLPDLYTFVFLLLK